MQTTNSSTAQQLNSSTAQQLNSSTAQQLNSRIASFLAIASMVASLAGCEGALSAGTAEQVSEPRKSFDAGIVFCDRENYLCIGFEQLGLAADDVVASVVSSCECVEPRIVSFRSPRGRDASAVLLRFVKEGKSNSKIAEQMGAGIAEASPVNLGVLIDMKLADGSVRQFTVNVLHTSLMTEIES